MIKNFKFEIEDNIKSIFISNALIMLLILIMFHLLINMEN